MKILMINENRFDDENYTPHSFSYPAATEWQLALGQQLTLVPLNAHTTYLYALREALFTLNLHQHPYWASPLSCPIQTEPCSTLMSLLCGATRICVSDEEIKNNPRLIENERIHLIGISNDLQQLWNQGGLPIRYLKYCYTSPLDTHFQTWKSFVQLNKLEKTPHFDLVMDNSLGGAVLFSRPSLEPFNIFLKPALGTSWYLGNINGSEQESLTGFGLFEIEHSDTSHYTATQMDNQLMLTGVSQPSRKGMIFLMDQVEETVADLSFVEECMLYHTPKAGLMFSHYFVLLVFVNPLKEEVSASDKETWTFEINNAITYSLGSGYLPDKIEYFSLIPKRNILGIDRNWCVNQYSSGLLLQKKELSQYRILSSLKKLIQEFTHVS